MMRRWHVMSDEYLQVGNQQEKLPALVDMIKSFELVSCVNGVPPNFGFETRQNKTVCST